MIEGRPISILEKVSPQNRELFTTVGMRVRAAKNVVQNSPEYSDFQRMTRQEWISMDVQTYQTHERIAAEVHQVTKNVRSDRYHNASVSAMDVDFPGLVQHIRVMQFTMRELWNQGLYTAFPRGATLPYAQWLCLAHDYFRFANINGPLPLGYVDQVSDANVLRLFPNAPTSEHLHAMSMITGVEPLPEDTNLLPYIYKLLDTTGKTEPRFPDTFFDEGGNYDKWMGKQIAKGAIPFYAIKRNVAKEERHHLVTPDEYKQRDKELTLKGFEFLKQIIPGVDYNDILLSASERVLSDPTIVRNFGREKETA